MALTKAKLIELIGNGDIDVGNSAANPNILHNWDFRNPVNQRGVSGAISTGSYFFDRWVRNSGTVTVAAGYLTLASDSVVEQRIEGLYLAGATVTVSVRVGSTIYGGTGVFPTAAGTVDITLTNFGTATLGYNAGYMFVRFTAYANLNVVSVKCELGTVSTLRLDPPMDYGVELAKCQRYYIRLNSAGKQYCYLGYGFAETATLLAVLINLPVTMRIIPTVALSGVVGAYNGATINVTSVAIGIGETVIQPNIVVKATLSGLTPGAPYYLISNSVGKPGRLMLSADL